MQTRALRRISTWISFCLVLSTIGLVLIYLGYTADPRNLFMLVPGIIMFIVFIILALVFGYGHRNGRRNVEKMIDALERDLKKKNRDL